MLQITANISQAAAQGLIPDLVPEVQRGRASGVKAVMELLPIFLVIFIGPLVDNGKIWTVIGIVGGGFLVGFGSRYAAGCTSGHGITGLSNLQLPSLVAVLGFFAGGFIGTFLLLPLVL